MKYTKTFIIGFVVLLLVVAGYLIMNYRITAEVKAKVEEQIQAAEPDVKVTYKNLEVNPFSREVTLEGVVLLPAGLPLEDAITIQHLNFKMDQADNGDVTYLRAAANGITTPITTTMTQYPMFYQLTKGMGISSLKSRAAVVYEYNPKTQHMNIDFLHAIKDLGIIKLSLAINQFTPDSKTIPELEQITVEKASLQYQDNSLFPKVFTILAKQQGLNEKQYTDQLIQSIQAKSASGQSFMTQTMAQALTTFIQQPQDLVIHINPAQPVAIGSLRGLTWSQIYQKLNLTVTADKQANLTMGNENATE